MWARRPLACVSQQYVSYTSAVSMIVIPLRSVSRQNLPAKYYRLYLYGQSVRDLPALGLTHNLWCKSRSPPCQSHWGRSRAPHRSPETTDHQRGRSVVTERASEVVDMSLISDASHGFGSIIRTAATSPTLSDALRVVDE